jgi:hypothetical protein
LLLLLLLLSSPLPRRCFAAAVAAAQIGYKMHPSGSRSSFEGCEVLS